jgi:hypothetical protein
METQDQRVKNRKHHIRKEEDQHQGNNETQSGRPHDTPEGHRKVSGPPAGCPPEPKEAHQDGHNQGQRGNPHPVPAVKQEQRNVARKQNIALQTSNKTNNNVWGPNTEPHF